MSNSTSNLPPHSAAKGDGHTKNKNKGTKPEPTEPKPPEAIYGFSVTADSCLAERIFDPSHDEPLFAVRQGGYLHYALELEVDNTRYLPTPDVNGSEPELVSSILRFLHRYTDVPHIWEDFMCAYVLMTWVYQRFTSVPYLRFLGPSDSGKSRMAYVVASICYRTCFVSGATSPAAMYRLVERFGGTLFVDEADYKDSDLWSEVAKVFNAGYRKNNPIVKCDRDNMPESFDCFCPKILSTRQTFGDEATDSRCLTLLTQKKPHVRSDIRLQLPMETFVPEAQELRNKLLMWRLDNYHHIRLDAAIERKFPGLETRMSEILSPLVAVRRDDQEFHGTLARYFGKYAEQQRVDSPHAIVVEAVSELLGPKTVRKSLSAKDVAQKASEIRASREPEAVREAAKAANGHGEEKLYFSGKQAGYLVRALGFETSRTKTGYVFEASRERVAELFERYPPASPSGDGVR